MQAVHNSLTVNPAVVAAALDDEMILLNVETGIYFGLDAVGAEIWRQLAEGADETTIIDRLLAQYEVAPIRLRVDLANFLTTLAAKGLIRMSES
jgi:hypothetical protein